jgi:hypothetical protein
VIISILLACPVGVHHMNAERYEVGCHVLGAFLQTTFT